ncbi:hypothetical protein N4T77_05480 [Clostridium sp. CX1]|uniref:hypothetical protein n=1 Tax=Clostridium sp. CX1 TaxID=2978346 RepID=UPI0021C06453|nr:hypothetical protein [Clostridium sp. CX1]MCT8976044.1 hypothetical protein [Clostridium sp. CX1]
MIAKKGILEIFENHMSYRDLFSISLLHRINKRRKKESLKIEADSIQDIKIHVRNKNLFIVVHGEEVYVKLITLPKVSKEKLYFIIKQELRVRFENLDSIMFTYEILKDNGNSLDIIIFCLNWNGVNLVEKCIEAGGEVKGIYPIQFCILNSYRNQIKSENYVLVFSLEGNVYLVGYYKDRIVGNTVLKNFNLEGLKEELDIFIVKCNILSKAKEMPAIFFLNFFNKELIQSLSKDYICEDLGELDKEYSINQILK